MKPTLLLALSAGLLLALPSKMATAAPDETILPAAPVDRDVTPPPETVWYGYKLLIADAASFGLLVAGMSADMAPVGVPGLAGMFIAAPAVHLSEGEGGRALGSLGLRLLMPVAGGLIAGGLYELDQKDSRDCDCMGGIFAVAGGMALGLAGAMIVDAAWLGWGKKATAEKSVALLPSLAVTPNGASMGLAGRF